MGCLVSTRGHVGKVDACILAVLLKLRDEGNQTRRDERKCSRL